EDLEGRPGQAAPLYLRVLALGDWNPLAVRRAATLLSRASRYQDADQILTHADARGALPGDLYRPAAEIALRTGNTERACRLARRAVAQAKRPGYREQLWLGRILDAAGRGTEAGQVLDDAAREAPDRADTWLALLAYQARRKRREGIETCLAEMRQN